MTKYRHPMFTAAHLDRVQEIMWDVYAVGGAPASVLHQYIEQEDRPYPNRLTSSLSFRLKVRTPAPSW